MRNFLGLCVPALMMVFGSFIRYPLIIEASMTIDAQNTARFKPTVQFYKVEIGSRAVIELESYPLNEYGTIERKPITISDSSYHDSLIAGQIGLNKPVMKKILRKAKIKKGLFGSAHVIAEESTLLVLVVKFWGWFQQNRYPFM